MSPPKGIAEQARLQRQSQALAWWTKRQVTCWFMPRKRCKQCKARMATDGRTQWCSVGHPEEMRHDP